MSYGMRFVMVKIHHRTIDNEEIKMMERDRLNEYYCWCCCLNLALSLSFLSRLCKIIHKLYHGYLHNKRNLYPILLCDVYLYA